MFYLHYIFHSGVVIANKMFKIHPALSQLGISMHFAVIFSDLRLQQQCYCRVGVHPGWWPPGKRGKAPPHSPTKQILNNN